MLWGAGVLVGCLWDSDSGSGFGFLLVAFGTQLRTRRGRSRPELISCRANGSETDERLHVVADRYLNPNPART